MLPHIGPKTQEKLLRLGINSTTSLLYHFPSRYLDFSSLINIQDLKPNTHATVNGTVQSFQNIFTRSHKNLQKAKIGDSTGTLEVIWFNQPYLSKIIKVGSCLKIAGTVSLFQNKLTIISPMIGDLTTGRIVPIYPETKNLKSGWFRKIFDENLPLLTKSVSEPLPPQILKQFSLIPLPESLRQIHQPTDFTHLESAKYRLAIQEAISLQANSQILKHQNYVKTPKKIFQLNSVIQKEINNFLTRLPFKLTTSQKSAWSEILSDLVLDHPINRLLIGDVGSGKTILALLSSIIANQNSTQTLLLAPTEILALQHFQTFTKYLPNFPIYVLTAHHRIQKYPHNSIIIATHAAIVRKSQLIKNTGLLIVDEQHRFGVNQRTFLMEQDHPPHTLTMTATPIPRTISLSIFGHLECSYLESPPSQKLPIKSFLVPPTKQIDCYRWIDQFVTKTNQQVFIVCPFIDKSETQESIQSATESFEQLKTLFPHHHLGLLHGKIKPADRQKILEDFSKNKINILVATPIIEVGIDYPNANCMVILSSERFGLAQLHQLRGRIGRGSAQGYCYFFTTSTSQKSLDRLQFISTHHTGQEIAEYDLMTRGPGEIFSTIQHGFPSLKLADISDQKLIDTSHQILTDLLQNQPNFDLNTLLMVPSTNNLTQTN